MSRGYPVSCRGKIYPNGRAAARALGVDPTTVYYHLRNGTMDLCGLGPGKHQRRSEQSTGGKKSPVVVAGHSFASIASLARAIGRDRRSVADSLAGGKLAQSRLIQAVLKWAAQGNTTPPLPEWKPPTKARRSAKRGRKPKPLTYRGKRFPSVVALAQELGCSTAVIKKARENRTVNSIPSREERAQLDSIILSLPGEFTAAELQQKFAQFPLPLIVKRLMSLHAKDKLLRRKQGEAFVYHNQ